jgi:hypothetical protein
VLDISEEDVLELCNEFLKDIGSVGHCINIRGQRKMGCNCMSVFRHEEQEVTKDDAQSNADYVVSRQVVSCYLVYFNGLKKDAQQRTVMDWIRYSSMPITLHDEDQALRHNEGGFANHCKFHMPFIAFDEEEDEDNSNEVLMAKLAEHCICSSTLMELLNVGKTWWTTAQGHVKSNTMPRHGLRGKPSNRKRRFRENQEEDLFTYLETLKEWAEPTATQSVRNTAGLSIRNVDANILYRSPDWSMHGGMVPLGVSRGH